MSLKVWPLRGRRDEQVHLRPSFSFFSNLEDNRERMAQGYRCQAREEVRVLRFIPVGGELVRCPDIDRTSVKGQRFSRLEPCLEGLLGQLKASAIEQPGPGFVGSQCHGGGSEARGRMWKNQSTV